MKTFRTVATPKRMIIAGLVIAALLVAFATVLGALPGRQSANTGSTSSATGSNNPDGPVVPIPTSSASPAPFGSNNFTPRTSTEVENGATLGSTALPPSAPFAPLISAPLPQNASTKGALVTGFPAAISLSPKSTVATSSVSSSGQMLQATVSATTTDPSSSVLDYYQNAFAKIGLAAQNIPAVGGSTAYSFERAGNSITLTVTSTSKGSKYTVFGVLTTAGS